MPIRCWIGLWTTFFLLLVVMFDLSALVRYITRFTEESFACLIAIIFIYEAFKKQFHIIDHYGITPDPHAHDAHYCECFPPGYKPPVVLGDYNESLSNMTTTTTMMTTTTGLIVNMGSGILNPFGQMFPCL